MTGKLISLLTLCAACAFVCEARAQRRSAPVNYYLEELAQVPLDTITTDDPDTKIILYSNNTWSYYRPTIADVMGPMEIFNRNWETSHVFAYGDVEHEDLPSVVELNLIKSLDEFHYPIKGAVRSKYGRRGRRNHNGVDIPLHTGEPVYATFGGKVRYSGYNTGGFGYLVIIRHTNGLETWYAHLSKCNAEVDDYVKAGQVIGFGGNTGRSYGAHLHYETRYKDQAFDPEFLIDFPSGELKYQTFALERSFFNINSRASDELEEEDENGNLIMMASNDRELDSEAILSSIERSQSQGATITQGGNAVYHTIRQGDMLGKLAVKYGVSIDQICRLNNITRTTTLRIGRRLRIR